VVSVFLTIEKTYSLSDRHKCNKACALKSGISHIC